MKNYSLAVGQLNACKCVKFESKHQYAKFDKTPRIKTKFIGLVHSCNKYLRMVNIDRNQISF